MSDSRACPHGMAFRAAFCSPRGRLSPSRLSPPCLRASPASATSHMPLEFGPIRCCICVSTTATTDACRPRCRGRGRAVYRWRREPTDSCAARCAASPTNAIVTASDASPPFTLTRWRDGTLSLADEATGRRIDLDAFGPTQAASLRPPVQRQGDRQMSFLTSLSRQSLRIPLHDRDRKHTANRLHAHVEIDGDFAIEPGDEVQVDRRPEPPALRRQHRRAPQGRSSPARAPSSDCGPGSKAISNSPNSTTSASPNGGAYERDHSQDRDRRSDAHRPSRTRC